MRKHPLTNGFPSVRKMIIESALRELKEEHDMMPAVLPDSFGNDGPDVGSLRVKSVRRKGHNPNAADCRGGECGFGGDDVLPSVTDDMGEYVAWLKSAFASLAALDDRWERSGRILDGKGMWEAFAKNAKRNGVYSVSDLRKWVEGHAKKRVGESRGVPRRGRGRSKLMESHWEEDTVIDPSLPGGGHGRYEFDDNGDLVDYESDEDAGAREKLGRRFRREKFARGEFKPYINGSTPLYLIAVLMLNGRENIILADREPSVDEVQSYIDEVMGAKYSNQKGKTFIGTSNPGYIVADARLITQKEAEKIDPDFEDSVYINGRIPPLVSGFADYNNGWYGRGFR